MLNGFIKRSRSLLWYPSFIKWHPGKHRENKLSITKMHGQIKGCTFQGNSRWSDKMLIEACNTIVNILKEVLRTDCTSQWKIKSCEFQKNFLINTCNLLTLFPKTHSVFNYCKIWWSRFLLLSFPIFIGKSPLACRIHAFLKFI